MRTKGKCAFRRPARGVRRRGSMRGLLDCAPPLFHYSRPPGRSAPNARGVDARLQGRDRHLSGRGLSARRPADAGCLSLGQSDGRGGGRRPGEPDGPGRRRGGPALDERRRPYGDRPAPGRITAEPGASVCGGRRRPECPRCLRSRPIGRLPGLHHRRDRPRRNPAAELVEDGPAVGGDDGQFAPRRGIRPADLLELGRRERPPRCAGGEADPRLAKTIDPQAVGRSARPGRPGRPPPDRAQREGAVDRLAVPSLHILHETPPPLCPRATPS